MTFTLKTALLSSALGLTLLGCNDPGVKDTTNQTEIIKTEFIDFMGEQVAISGSFPKHLLNQTDEEFRTYFLSLHGGANLRTTAEESAISSEELMTIVTPVVNKYPDVSWEKEISDKDLKRIYKDFKSIKTLDEIREKSEVIVNYYDALIKEEVIPQIIEYKKVKKNKGARVTWDPLDPFDRMNIYEQSVALNHPRYSTGYVTAGGQATAASSLAGLGNNDIPTKANAMRHAAWNCFGIRNVILLGSSEGTAVNYLRECTSAHEMDDAGNRILTSDAAMDLHNNMVGRTWMADETGWGFAWARKMPSEPRIANTMQIRAERAIQYDDSNVSGIISRQGGWDVLYNNNTGSDTELVYIIN